MQWSTTHGMKPGTMKKSTEEKPRKGRQKTMKKIKNPKNKWEHPWLRENQCAGNGEKKVITFGIVLRTYQMRAIDG